ncbi:MAG: tetratricopeptide repeat protein [Vampirovibrionales bacterium]|nr:tetratricopeptide repeat protein [Vampirovibrionales bacterium]
MLSVLTPSLPMSRLVSVGLVSTLLVGLTGCDPVVTVQEWVSTFTKPSIASMSEADKQALSQKYFDEGVAAQTVGDTAKAKASFEKVIAIFPQHVSANVNLGVALAQQKQWPKATERLNTALAAEPNNADANANLAWVLAEQHLWPQALQAALKATRLNPDNGYAFATLGWVYTETEQLDEAAGAYSTALAKVPTLNAARVGLGKLQCRLGKLTEAQAQLAALPAGSAEATDLNNTIAQGCKASK